MHEASCVLTKSIKPEVVGRPSQIKALMITGEFLPTRRAHAARDPFGVLPDRRRVGHAQAILNTRMKSLAITFAMAATFTLLGREYHVSVQGNDANDGSKSKPFKTISAAALRAQPGDVITVHAGRLSRARQSAARRGVRHETHRLSGRARREGRHHRLRADQGLGEGRRRHLEGDPPERFLRQLQSLRGPHPRRLVWRTTAAVITPARSI